MFIAAPNERLNYSLLIYRRKLTYTICIDFKLAAGMKSKQHPSFDKENISI